MAKRSGKSVAKCVHCGTDQRNFFGKHKILTGILALVLIGGIGSALGSGNEKPASAPAPTTAAAPKAEPAKPVELSKEGVSSDVKITVLEFGSASTIGDNQFATAKAQGIFRVVKLSVVYNQKDAITVDTASFKLVDDQKREFSASSEAKMGYEASVKNKKEGFSMKQLNPGMAIEGYVAVDIPKDAKGFTLRASGGMTGKPVTLKVE